MLLSRAFQTGLLTSSAAAVSLVARPAKQPKQPLLCSRAVAFLAAMGFVMGLLASPARVRAVMVTIPALFKIFDNKDGCMGWGRGSDKCPEI